MSKTKTGDKGEPDCQYSCLSSKKPVDMGKFNDCVASILGAAYNYAIFFQLVTFRDDSLTPANF